jgi:hypothetical protein
MTVPRCPIHEAPLAHDFGSWPLALLPEEFGPGPLFKCVSGQCGLRSGQQHEHFELRDGRPKYTNLDSSKRMRCRIRGHGCLFVAEISRGENKRTWRCASCARVLKASPGIWVNPPEW